MVSDTTDINVTKQLLSPVSRSCSFYSVDKGHLNDNIRTLEGWLKEIYCTHAVVTSYALLAERLYTYSKDT